MKIGILTFHRALNYGAVLQCYALYHTLSEMGHDVEVIDYRPEAIEKYRMLFRWQDFKGACGVKGKMRYLASSLALIDSKVKTARKFDDFISKNLNVSAIVMNESDMPDYYDAIFFGSDQIWNPLTCEGLDKIYYGSFEKHNARFIGYAVSIGREDLITGRLSNTFKSYLTNFDKLSVREKAFQLFLSDKFQYKSQLVCDPSLLMQKKQCEKIAVNPQDRNYVVLFSLTGNPYAMSLALRVANQLNAEVVSLCAEMNMIKRKSYHRGPLSINEFLGYIKNSKCVITDSFHATSFSIIMNVDFYTFRQKNNNDRSQMILDVSGLSDRMIDADDIVVYSPVDYIGVNRRLNEYREKSLNFIVESLK